MQHETDADAAGRGLATSGTGSSRNWRSVGTGAFYVRDLPVTVLSLNDSDALIRTLYNHNDAKGLQ